MKDDININIPTYKKRSNLEKFIYGFKQLCKETGMTQIEYGGFKSAPIIVSLNFDNGESIGTNRLFWEIGFNKP